MAVEVIESGSVKVGMNAAVVVIQADTIEQVLSSEARSAAIMKAQTMGMHRAGISNQSGPYPVDDEGRDCTLEAREGMKYRNDYQIASGI